MQQHSTAQHSRAHSDHATHPRLGREVQRQLAALEANVEGAAEAVVAGVFLFRGHAAHGLAGGGSNSSSGRENLFSGATQQPNNRAKIFQHSTGQAVWGSFQPITPASARCREQASRQACRQARRQAGKQEGKQAKHQSQQTGMRCSSPHSTRGGPR